MYQYLNFLGVPTVRIYVMSLAHVVLQSVVDSDSYDNRKKVMELLSQEQLNGVELYSIIYFSQLFF